MLTLKTIKRVTVYTSKALEDVMTSQFLALGSNGFTVTDCRGHGEHGVLTDPLSAASHVRIELLVGPAVAEKVLAYLQMNQLRSQAVAACVEDVQVPSADQY